MCEVIDLIIRLLEARTHWEIGWLVFFLGEVSKKKTQRVDQQGFFCLNGVCGSDPAF